MERSFRSRSPSVSVDADYAADRKGGTTTSQRLLVAIMRRAIWDFVLYKDEDPKLHKNPIKRKKAAERLEIATEAAGWLFWDGEEETDEHGRYTFKFICSMLDMQPETVRARALALTREEIQALNNHIKEE